MLTKQRKLTPPFFAIVFLLVLSLQLPFQDSVRASELIGDNFDDKDYDGWYDYGAFWNRTDNKMYPMGSGNFSAADQTLKVIGPSSNATGDYLSVAYINSSISYGTWSFDLFIFNSTLGWCVVQLFGDHYNPPFVNHWGFGSATKANRTFQFWVYTRNLVSYHDRPKISLERYYDNTAQITGEYEFGSPTDTWTNCSTHFDITRNSTGYFNIYVNGTLRISEQDMVGDMSGYFAFWGQTGWSIDNILFYDYIVPPPPPETTTTTTTTTTSDLTPLMIAIGAIELIIIIILAILYIRRRP